jgi:signal transduction histidine kinase
MPGLVHPALLATPPLRRAMPARPDDIGSARTHAAPASRAPVPAGPAAAQPEGAATVSAASARLRALAALSGSLTDALSPEAAAYLVEQRALAALGAVSAVVVTLGAFPPPSAFPRGPAPVLGAYEPPAALTLHVVHAIGVPGTIRNALEALPLDAPVPYAEVARDGKPVFLASEAEMQRYPAWASDMIGASARAAAIVPVWANGELRGVLGLAWPEPHDFDEDERAFVSTLGVMCAQAIMRAHLKAAELQARQAAEQANASKAQFLATISHELRTPVNAVIGYSALLAEEISGPVSDLQRDHLTRMSASGQHLLGLIEDLLGYARIEAGEEVVRPERVGLAEVMQESVDLVRPLAERKGLRVRVEGPTEGIEIETDPRKLRQILVNVLGNAVKFTAAGDVTLDVRIEGTEPCDEEPCVHVYFEVTDTGAGLSLADQAHVFDLYWQHDPASTHRDGSSGLGLSVARRLAWLLGGDIAIGVSVLGQGSTFVVALPARYVVGAPPVRIALAQQPTAL